jgi:hypothetical protein
VATRPHGSTPEVALLSPLMASALLVDARDGQVVNKERLSAGSSAAAAAASGLASIYQVHKNHIHSTRITFIAQESPPQDSQRLAPSTW